jgi:putative membrane protein insertion efficiency factor
MFARLTIWLIRLYQRSISRLMPSMCRFTPSCSQYSIRAFQLHGFWRGLYLTCLRIGRCNPFNAGGYDPVPGDSEIADTASQTDSDQNKLTERQ